MALIDTLNAAKVLIDAQKAALAAIVPPDPSTIITPEIAAAAASLQSDIDATPAPVIPAPVAS